MTTTKTRDTTARLDVLSIGFLSQQTQLPPAMLRKLLPKLEIEPILTLNGVEHFDGDAMRAVCQYLEEQREQFAEEETAN